jgi:hypothetical protein
MKLILLALAALLVGPVLATAQSTKNIDITVTHGNSCAGGPTVSVVEPTAPAGSTIHVNFACGPGNQKDWISLVTAPTNQGNSPIQYVNGATSGTLTFTAPNATSDRDLQYIASFQSNDSYTVIAQSAPFTVPATINPPTPSAALPAALAADPFTPQHVMTVCAAGCDFTSWGDALTSATANHWDFVQVKISAGEYPYPANSLVDCHNYPQHLWVKGISPDGRTFPHIFGVVDHAGQIFSTGCYFKPTTASLTLDNLEMGPWNSRLSGLGDSTTVTLRNVYLRDSSQGIISGNSNDFVLNIYNSVVARHGSGNGPEHDVYIGEGAGSNIVNVVNSVFEQPIVGHAFKERAKIFNATCSMFLVNQDSVYTGSETIDMDSAQPTFTNILSANGGGSSGTWTINNSWDNTRYGVDNESAPYPVNLITITGSTFLADQAGSAHNFVTLGLSLSTTPHNLERQQVCVARHLCSSIWRRRP